MQTMAKMRKDSKARKIADSFVMTTRKYRSRGKATVTVAPILKRKYIEFCKYQKYFPLYLSDVGDPLYHIEKGI